MDLTRRKLILSGGVLYTISALGTYEVIDATISDHDAEVVDEHREDMFRIFSAVYPWNIEPESIGLGRFLSGLPDERAQAINHTMSGMNQISNELFGVPIRRLSKTECRSLLESIGVSRIQASPSGTLAQRARFYLVNTVLYAALIQPSGTRPFGIENPPGYPGGFYAPRG